MNWKKLLERAVPIAMDVATEIVDGIMNGATDEEIRERVAAPGGILDKSLKQLRDDEEDLLDFARG